MTPSIPSSNRTFMELKCMLRALTTMYWSSNRTFMELKLQSAIRSSKKFMSSNRTFMELKSKYVTDRFMFHNLF